MSQLSTLMMSAGLAPTANGPVQAKEGRGYRVVEDIAYVAADYADDKGKLDVYLPEPAVESAPVIVLIHGGALMEGSKSDGAHVGRCFASAGIVTVVINYRLSPTVEHPAHVRDAAAAIAWVQQNAARYGGDPESVFVLGHSAGAYLATLLAFDPRYLAEQGLRPLDLRGVVSVSAFFDVAAVAPERPKGVWGADRERWREASVTTYWKAEGPPLLLLYADGDDTWRRKQNDDALAELERLEYPDIGLHQISDRNHITVWTRIAPGDELSDQIERFVREHGRTGG